MDRAERAGEAFDLHDNSLSAKSVPSFGTVCCGNSAFGRRPKTTRNDKAHQVRGIAYWNATRCRFRNHTAKRVAQVAALLFQDCRLVATHCVGKFER